MAQKDRKQLIIKELANLKEPISLQNLLKTLGKEYSERTLRRWLSEMINQGVVEKLGQKKGTIYQLAKTSNAELPSLEDCFSPESKKIMENIHKPIHKRPLIIYNDDWILAYKPNQTFYIPSPIRTKLQNTGKRSKQEEPAGTFAYQIFNRLLIDLSYNSSRLEGNTYSLLDTERLLLQGTSPDGKLDEEKQMILNHKEAIGFIVNNAARLTISEKTIYTLHYLLSDGLVDKRYSGKLRDHGVRIGGSTYLPYEDKKKLLLLLDQILKKAILIKNPYEQSFFLLVHITYLQGFVDVNKRTARLSANIPLIKNNLVPSAIVCDSYPRGRILN